MSLKPRQKGLYLTLKSKYKKNPRTGEDNRNEIVMTATESKEQYGDLRTFRADIDILIERGFIKQTFSDKWKLYGTDNFYIPEEDKRYKKKR